MLEYFRYSVKFVEEGVWEASKRVAPSMEGVWLNIPLGHYRTAEGARHRIETDAGYIATGDGATVVVATSDGQGDDDDAIHFNPPEPDAKRPKGWFDDAIHFNDFNPPEPDAKRPKG